MSIEVSSLHYYPIKSCGGIEARVIEVVETGFKHDREWMLVDANNKFMSQRSHKEMALIQPFIEDGQLRVSAPDMEDLSVPINSATDESITAILHKLPVDGQIVSAESTEWFSDFFHADVRLVHSPPETPRQINYRYHKNDGTNRVGFADSFAFLLTSTVALDQLNTNLEESVPMNRFRPNIVVSDPDNNLEAYGEDYWREIKIGKLRAFVVRGCDRCPIPDTDQRTGERPDRPVTAALKQTRHGADATHPDQKEGNFFGQNLNHVFEPGQIIKVGDQVEILKRSTERNIILEAA